MEIDLSFGSLRTDGYSFRILTDPYVGNKSEVPLRSGRFYKSYSIPGQQENQFGISTPVILPRVI
jgi:hypothetical protein